MNLRQWSGIYAFWAVAVCSRAAWQYVTHDGDLLPTHLSLLAGVIYIVIAWSSYRHRPRPAMIGLTLELLGVLGVSTYEIWTPLAYATAWSHFGSGYLYLPLILPIAGIWSLWRIPHTT